MAEEQPAPQSSKGGLTHFLKKKFERLHISRSQVDLHPAEAPEASTSAEEKHPKRSGLFSFLNKASKAAEDVQPKHDVEEVKQMVEETQDDDEREKASLTAGRKQAGQKVAPENLVEQHQLTTEENEAAYVSVLRVVDNVVGGYNDSSLAPDKLHAFAEKAYHIDAARQQALQNKADELAPEARTYLRLTLKQASNLLPKDVSNTSDPFAILRVYDIGSADKSMHHIKDGHADAHQQQVSSICHETNNPVWNEAFEFEIPDPECILVLDLWDSDDDESVVGNMHKMRRLGNLSRAMREGLQSLSGGKDGSSDFLGCVDIPIIAMPAEGSEHTFPMQKRSEKSHVSGEVTVHIAWFTKPVRDDLVGKPTPFPLVQLHYSLIEKLILIDAIEFEGDSSRAWDGQFSKQSEHIIFQHALQNAITPLQQKTTMFRALADYHVKEGLNIKQLLQTLQETRKLMSATREDDDLQGLTEQEAEHFVGAVENTITACLAIFRNLFHFVTSDKDGAVYLATVVRLLRLCFQTALWRAHGANSDRREANEVEKAFVAHLQEYYSQQSALLEGNAEFEGHDVVRVVQLTRVLTEQVGSLRAYSSAGFEALGLEPVFLAMDTWDDLLLAEIKTVIDTWSGSQSTAVNEDEEITKYGIVFELYFIVRQMSKSLEDDLDDAQLEQIKLNQISTIFEPVLLHWISLVQVMGTQWVQQAIELDDLSPAGGHAKHTSSIIDVFRLLNDIWGFWVKLDWPVAQESDIFKTMLADSICNVGLAYMRGLHSEISRQGYFDTEGRFDISPTLCLALNNIQETSYKLEAIKELMGVDEENERHLDKVREEQGDEAAASEHNQTTLKKMFDNALSNARVQQKQISHRSLFNMMPDMVQYLAQAIFHSTIVLEAADRELTDKDVETVAGEMLDYINHNLEILVNEVYDEVFTLMLKDLWLVVLDSVQEVLAPSPEVTHHLDTLSSHQLFVFQRIVDNFRVFFHQDGDGLPKAELESDEFVLTMELLALAENMPTQALVDQLYMSLGHASFGIHSQHPRGQLKCVAQVSQADDKFIVTVHLLNATNLPSMDRNGYSDPYVIAELYPQEGAIIASAKSKVVSKTLNPEFNDVVKLETSRLPSNGVLRLLVVDYDRLSAADYLGEAYVDLNPMCQEDPMGMAHEFTLSLIKPKLEDRSWQLLRLLERRQSGKDKEASEQVKKLRKVVSSKLKNES
eukprot:m.166033 g.166033  ORF g.166033 m.166033 type:complete len:1208 (+) comp16609_c0_seq1:55-3678(+)